MHVCASHTSSRVGHRCPALRAGDGGLKMFVWHSNPPNVTDSYVKSTTYRIVLTITYLRLSGGRQSYYGSTKHSGVYRGDVIGMDPKGEVGLLL